MSDPNTLVIDVLRAAGHEEAATIASKVLEHAAPPPPTEPVEPATPTAGIQPTDEEIERASDAQMAKAALDRLMASKGGRA